MKVGLLDRGVWGSISDFLGDLSALSSFKDAVNEGVYEEVDDLGTLGQKDLQDSPRGCLCQSSWDLWLLAPSGCQLSSQHPQTPRVPQTHRKQMDGLLEPRETPASIYTAGAKSVPSQT